VPPPEYRPAPPFADWPEQWSYAAFGYAWLVLTPVALVTQSTVSVATAEAVNAAQDFSDEVVALMGAEGLRGAVIIHDWRSFEHIDPAARNTWMARARRPGRPFSGVSSTTIATSARPLVRLALQASSLGVRLVSGVPATLMADQPEGALRAHGIHAPPAGLVERLRAAKRVP